MAGFLRLVEEAAALEQACAFLGGHFDISRRQQEHLVGDALHAPVEGVGEPAREIDEALREILIGALEIEDHRNRLLELVGDLLRVVEASRHDQVHANGGRRRHGGDPRPQHGRPVVRGLGIGPVVEFALSPARGEAPHVRALGVAPLEVLVGDVGVFVPVLFLGDAEVDEGLVPHVRKAHLARNVTPRTGLSPRGRGSLPPAQRPCSPGSSPWTARPGCAPRRAHGAGGSRNAGSCSGSIPDFDASPARLTSTRAGTVSRRAADSESSEWTSSQRRLTTFTLFDWRWPMKCQRNASPYSACLRSRSCARFSPTTSMPASASTPRSASATYFVAATIVTVSPTSARMRS